MKWDDLFEEKAVDKIFRGGIGGCQSRDCLVVKVMTELTPMHPFFFFPPRICLLIPNFLNWTEVEKWQKSSHIHMDKNVNYILF